MSAVIKETKTVNKILNDKVKPYLKFNKSGKVPLYQKDYDKLHGSIVRNRPIYGNPIEIYNPFKVVIELYRG